MNATVRKWMGIVSMAMILGWIVGLTIYSRQEHEPPRSLSENVREA